MFTFTFYILTYSFQTANNQLLQNGIRRLCILLTPHCNLPPIALVSGMGLRPLGRMLYLVLYQHHLQCQSIFDVASMKIFSSYSGHVSLFLFLGTMLYEHREQVSRYRKCFANYNFYSQNTTLTGKQQCLLVNYNFIIYSFYC